jgi:peptidoglycan hydrolase-like protein with peptidoglycan-binding domain
VRALFAVPILVLVAVALAVLSGGGSEESASAEESGVPTAPVERRDLAERVSVDGTLGYAGSAEVITRMAGTITWLPAAGAVIGRGDRLLEVDGEPVLLMYGSVPAYRDLASGVSDGPDVRELERNLSGLGYDPGEIDDSFTSTTAGAVAEWQEDLGLEQTGEVELGRVVFLSGERRVSSLDVALGSDTGSAGGGSDGSGTSAAYDGATAATMFASATTTTAETGADRGSQSKKKRPSGKSSGGSGGSKGSGSGGGTSNPGNDAQGSDRAAGDDSGSTAGQDSGAAQDPTAGADDSAPATQVMTTTSTRRVVTVALDTADLSLAKRGRTARITFPSGQTTRGRISSVGTVAESSSDSSDPAADDSGTSTVDVTIAIIGKAKVPNLEDAPVTVELVEDLRRDVLAVPVESLVGTAGGEYAVVVSDADGRRQVPVEVGLFADGYVEVEGEGLREGMAVEVPEGL